MPRAPDGDRRAIPVDALDEAPYGYAVIDPDWRYQYVNAAAIAILGKTGDELVGHRIWDVFPLIVGTSFEEMYRRVMETRTRESMVDYYAPLQRWFSIGAFPSSHGLGVVVDDVTDRLTAERAIHESEQRLRTVLEAFSAGFWDYHPVDDRLVISPRVREIFDVDPVAPFTWAQLLDVVHADDRPRFGTLIDVTRAQMDSFAIEYRITRPDGSERWCRSRGGATRDATGQTVRVVGTLLDVTDEVAGRMVVAELQRQIEESQRMARIGSWSWNMITGEVLWSAETYRLLEFDPSHTPSFQSVLDLAINDEQRARFLELVQDAIAGTRPYDFEISIRLQDGSLRHLHNYGTVERASDGAPIRMTGVFKDITVERQAALEREALQLKMQQSQKLESLGLLAGGIAHDFNNMLVGVLTNANSILLEAGPDAAHRTAVEEIERAGQRASELTRQLLAYSGRARFVVEPVNLSALTLEMTQLLRAALSAGARLDLQLVDDLPLVMGDATQLRQVVMNLITNASDALLEQSGVITLRTSVSSDTRVGDGVVSFGEHATAGPFVVLEVADTGTGMPPETVQRIFDPFFTTKFTGRGLGLAGSLGIMRAHGGRILVASRAGDGTTFRLELPVYEAAATTTPSGGIASAERRDASSPISDLMVLVVDDDPTVRNVIERTLLRMGHRVTMAGGGREALSALDEGLVPDLILLDLTMPEMGGREVLREIAKRDAGHKVVLVSGYNEIDLIADTSEPSLAGFLRKPFTVAELAGVIRESLR